MGKRGQVSIEGILVISVLMIVFLLALSFTFLRNSDIITTRAILDNQNDCRRVANAISQVKVLGDGSEARIYARPNITIISSSKLIITQDKKEKAYCSFEGIATYNYTNISGSLLVRNENGVITITK